MFRKMTAKHPERDVGAAMDRINKENEKKSSNRDEEGETLDNDLQDEVPVIQIETEAKTSALEDSKEENKGVDGGESKAEGGELASLGAGEEEGTLGLSKQNSLKVKSSQMSIKNQQQDHNSPRQNSSRLAHNQSKNLENTTIGTQSGLDKQTAGVAGELTGTLSKSQMKNTHSTYRKSQSAPKKLDTYMDPEFWYHKGVVLN